MSADIFGYDRNVNTKSILSTNECVLDFGAGKVALVQQAVLQYGHEISQVTETGSADIYFVTGSPSGSLQVDGIVGKNGFFDGFGLGDQACGELKTLSITAVSNGDCTVKIEKNNGLRLEGALLQGLGLTISVQNHQVAQQAKFSIGKLSRTTS